MNKRKPHRLEIPQIIPTLDVEKVLPTPRYLGRLQSNPTGNVGDYYFNSGSNDVRFLLETGQWYGVT